MITEDYCSFELSKLLKEKGFNVELQCYSYDAITKENVDIYWQKNINGLLPRCTHQMAMKWLREVHKLHIEIDVYKDIKYAWSLSHADSGEYVINPLKLKDKSYSTYEEAVEDAIKYVLENFI